jgi:HEAT repeat protein
MVNLGTEVLPVVIEALQDENEDVQMMAILACGSFRDPATIEPLAKWMRESDNRDIGRQTSCVVSLVKIGPQAYGPLLEASRNCGSEVRCIIPTALAMSWGGGAVPHLIELLEDSNGDVRQIAAYELGKLKDQRANASLIRHLSDPVDMVRCDSVGAIGELHDPTNIPAVRKLLNDPSPIVRKRAASVLKSFGFEPPTPSQPGKT